jgi:hypothetical protein
MSYGEGMRRTAAPLLLVVDEDEVGSAKLTTWLYGQGFNAVTAASFLEANAVLGAVAIEGLIGHLALRDGSLFQLAHVLRTQRPAVVIGYADVSVRPPPELDACFVQPLDLTVLSSLLAVRFGRRASGEYVGIRGDQSIPAAPPAAVAVRRRR